MPIQLAVTPIASSASQESSPGVPLQRSWTLITARSSGRLAEGEMIYPCQVLGEMMGGRR